MKTLFKIYGILILTAITFTACVEDDIKQESCTATYDAPVIDVTGPSEGTVGQEITLVVKFNTGNACYNNSYFSVTDETPKQIKVMSNYVGCECAQVTEPITKDYKFTPATVGEYEFKFRTANNGFITKTVTVTL